MRKIAIASAAAMALSAGSANAAAVLNGSFESGADPGSFTTVYAGQTNIDDWSVTGGSVDYIGTYWVAQDGARSVDLAGILPGTLTQTLTTSVNDTFRVTFWINRNPDGGFEPRTGSVSAGATAGTFAYTGNGAWEQKTFDFVATSATTTLSFSADASAGCCYGPALDNVSVATIAGVVPEPATWALFILGFGAIGGALRRKARQSVGLRFA